MSALHFVSHRQPGGADAMASLLARRLPGPARVIALTDLCPARRGPARLVAVPVLVVRLVRLLRRERPGAVMTHMPLAALLVSVAALVAGVPRRLVVQHASSDQFTTTTLRLDGLFARIGVFTDVIFVGEAVRASFPARAQGRAEVRTIRNGIDLFHGPRARRSRPVEVGGLTVVSVGALEPRKNLANLVRACASSGVVGELVVVGDGPERDRLCDLAVELGLRLRLPGQVPREEVLDQLVGADVFAFPSRSEALPLSVVEAAATGCPVVASGIAPNREVLGDAAIYCDPDDVDGWGSALRQLWEDPELCESLSERAVEQSRQFGVDAMLEHYRRVLPAVALGA